MKMSSNKSKALVVMFGTAVSFPAMVNTAFSAEDNRAAFLEEIIVTSRKIEESLQDTPISVSAFDSEDLEQKGVFELQDVGAYTPNLNLSKIPSADALSFSIRGVGTADPNMTMEQTVGTYIDGVYMARPAGSALDIVDLERIEVLKGPQGALFGKNTIGGAINVITEKPSGEFSAKQLLSFGNDDYFRTQTTIDIPEFKNLALKFSHLLSKKDGDIINQNDQGELGQERGEAIRIAARWTPNDTFELDYAYDKSEREFNGGGNDLSLVRPGHVAIGGAIYAQAAAYAKPGFQDNQFHLNSEDDAYWSNQEGHALTIEWDISDQLTLKSISAYRELKNGSELSDFGAFTSDGVTVIDINTFSPIQQGELVPLFASSRDGDQEQISQEFQMIGRALDDKLRYVAGIYYFNEKGDEKNPQQFVMPGPILLPSLAASGVPVQFLPCPAGGGAPTYCIGSDILVNNSTFSYGQGATSNAIFSQVSYDILPELEATIGLRYTEDEKDAYLVLSSGRVEDQNTWTNLSPSFTLSYDVSESLNVYGKVSKGYRSGGYNIRARTVSSFNTPFDEENMTSFELGIKSDWLENSLRVNGAIFQMDYSDLQISQFEAGAGGASSTIVNAGEATVDGLEVEVSWLPIRGLSVDLAYGYIDRDFGEYITSAIDPVSGFPIPSLGNIDIADSVSTISLSPEHSGSLTVAYTFKPWKFGQLTVNVDGTYSSEIDYAVPLSLYSGEDEYYFLNARATLSSIELGNGNMKISLWGKNLEDKEVRQFGFDFGSLGYVTNVYYPGRSIGIDLVYEFNR